MLFPDFISKWSSSAAAERANKDAFLLDLCDLLGVERPNPTTGDPERDNYVFEKDVVLAKEAGKSIGKIDLYKHGHFLLEAKQGSESTTPKLGTARRATASWNIAMHDAYGQALGYARTLPSPPPFIVITDIGYCFDLYAQFDGSGNYRKYPEALSSRMYLRDIEKSAETLRKIFTDPHALDLSKQAARVTRDIASHIAALARDLEAQKHPPELVAKFLMRCLFTMFAEDVELIRKGLFAQTVQERWIERSESFKPEVEDLWRTMNLGGNLFGVGKILQFNGGLFSDPVALPLTKQQLTILGLAAASDWKDVEPAIFGTLLERALDPKERHRLGAHFTPRAYVERLVKPTIEEPVREEWDLVRAEVRQIMSNAKSDDDVKAMVAARKPVYAFYDKLTKTRVLDPACGSGNFLYVSLDLFKRIENEILALLHDLGDDAIFNLHGRSVTPEQFLGIEIKSWAKEITELVLWIGYLQWQIRNRGWMTHIPEPVLRDYHNIECRDAVLAYDRVEPALDDEGKPITRWDGETMKKHPVTGEDVPDETARIPVMRYVNPRKAEWPKADFVVGNPPFVGDKRMKETLGPEYVNALRRTYSSDLGESSDLVMYWWDKAAQLVREKAARGFGFITTNSIRQEFNRRTLEKHLSASPPLQLRFAVPDHPWVDSHDGASVRISMTSGTLGSGGGHLVSIVSEASSGEEPRLELCDKRGLIRSDLTLGCDMSVVSALLANRGLSSNGVGLYGRGFVLSEHEATGLLSSDECRAHVIKRLYNGRDLTDRPRVRFVIDFYGKTETQARQEFPELFQIVADRVLPERRLNGRVSYREKWWMFGEPRPLLRSAMRGLEYFIGTPRTAKHRFFTLIPSDYIVETEIVAIAAENFFLLGTLSSRAHVVWSVRAGSVLEDRPRYNNSLCFDPFPFPGADGFVRQRIHNLGEQLDGHRKRQQELHCDLTTTAMYNVLEKLRSGEALTEKEKVIHEKGLVSVLKRIHDDLDAAVFDAYGWPHDLTDEEILERLVVLNAERAEEEKRGIIRWLRPEFQNPHKQSQQPEQGTLAISAEEKATHAPEVGVPAGKRAWPKTLPEQITAVRALTGDGTVDAKSIASHFKSARKFQVEEVLESLAALGLLVTVSDEPRLWRAV